MTRPGRPPSPAVRKRSPLRRRIHRTTGLATGVVLLYLIVTGLPLQLTNFLDLGNRYVTFPALLDWYGIRAPETGWQSDDVRFVGHRLFHDGVLIGEADSFQGAVSAGALVIAAAGRTLLVFPAVDPSIIESVRLTDPVERIGLSGSRVVLDTALGPLTLNPDTLEPGPPSGVDLDAIRWAMPTALRDAELDRYAAAARSRMLTVERLLQDLHSGRAFGPPGEWLIGLASLGLAILALTGFWIWWRSR